MNTLKEHIGEDVSCTYLTNIQESTINGALNDTNDSFVLVGSVCLPLKGKNITVTKIRSSQGNLYYSNMSYGITHPIPNIKKTLLKKVK